MSREHDEHRSRDVASDLHRMPIDPDVAPAPSPAPSAAALRVLLREHADLLPVIALGGALGSLARWRLAAALPHQPSQLAWATLIANVVGSLLLGVLMAFVLDVWSGRRYLRPFLGVGVLGGFTTFSTYELDARGLLAAGRPGLALAYVAGSLLGGLLAVTAGVVASRLAIDARRTAGSPLVTALLVVVGGLVGAPARYLTDLVVQSRHSSRFPWGTLTVNVVGSLILGIAAGLSAAGHVPLWVLTLVGTGFCGALTTFSTFSFETFRLLDERQWRTAVLNVLASVAAGLVAVAVGFWTGSR